MSELPAIAPADYSAQSVADYFIFLSSNKKIDDKTVEGVTPLKLQKLLYFAQAVSLSLYDKKLFEDNIEAWKYGPVIASLYQKYKTSLNSPLTMPSGDYVTIGDDKTKQLLKGVWELFGKYSAGELVEMTHNHAPWKDSYVVGANSVISPESIRDYYKNVFELQDNTNE